MANTSFNYITMTRVQKDTNMASSIASKIKHKYVYNLNITRANLMQFLIVKHRYTIKELFYTNKKIRGFYLIIEGKAEIENPEGLNG